MTEPFGFSIAPCNKVVVSLEANGPSPSWGVHVIHVGEDSAEPLDGPGPWSMVSYEAKGNHPRIDAVFFNNVKITYLKAT